MEPFVSGFANNPKKAGAPPIPGKLPTNILKLIAESQIIYCLRTTRALK